MSLQKKAVKAVKATAKKTTTTTKTEASAPAVASAVESKQTKKKSKKSAEPQATNPDVKAEQTNKTNKYTDDELKKMKTDDFSHYRNLLMKRTRRELRKQGVTKDVFKIARERVDKMLATSASK